VRPTRVLILGAGYAGTRVALRARAQGVHVAAAVRREEHAERLSGLGLESRLLPAFDERLRSSIDAATHVVVSFPPDGVSDARLAPVLARAGAITYVSSTAVYGELRGRIDDQTATPPPDARSASRLTAEGIYRALGATILRCPGIYGPERGLHVRLLRGEYRLPGDGRATLSRIHVEDLARFVLAAGAVRSETFVVGDLEPASHLEVVTFLCAAYALPFPPSVPLEDVHFTLRADRAIDAERARRVLGVDLAFPSYREGMAPGATGSKAAAAPGC